MWTELVPAGGWGHFDRHAELTAALWAMASAADWHYLNLTAGSSIWESRRDASTIGVHYDGEERIVELVISSGHAAELLAPVAATFGLVPVPDEARRDG